MVMRIGLIAAASLMVTATFCLAADAPATAPAQRKVMQAFGMSFIPPAGWTQRMAELPGEAATFVSPAKQGQKSSTITIRVQPAAGDLDANADSLAGKLGGAVRDDKATLDGEPAKVLWISKEGLSEELRAVAAQHSGLMYSIECTGPTGALPRETLDQFVRDFHWEKLEDIADHVQEDGPRVNVLNGKLGVTMPDVMRPAAPLLTQKDKFTFITPRANKPGEAEFICVLSTVNGPARFADAAAAYMSDLMKQNQGTIFQWVHTDDQKRLSNMVALKKNDMVGNPRVINTIVGIVKVDGMDQYVLLNFIVNTDDPAKKKAYEGAAKKIIDSMKAAPKQ